MQRARPQALAALQKFLLHAAGQICLAIYGYGLILFLGVECLGATELKLPTRQSAEVAQANWQQLQPGLEFAEFELPQSESTLSVLRIDPENFNIVLCSASNGNKQPASLDEWATREGLHAAINASMYLPDELTSTGYMRSGEHINNGRIMDRFGAFLVAGPRRAGLPRAQIIDRDDPEWRRRLDEYDTVVQNYRMTNSRRKILWSSGGPSYSISAITQDGQGRILFLHSRKPVEAHGFIKEVLDLPIDAGIIMYVEGGGQAGMLVDSGGVKRDLTGIHARSFLITGDLKARLPNVIGIKPREKEADFREVSGSETDK